MQPDLVCKITVQTPDGKQWRGSGYPITPNRIITAAHVVADAAYQEEPAVPGAARQIPLTFGSQETRIDGPIAVVWCGAEVGVDVAVLSCQLPLALQPAHALLTTPPSTPIAWHAQGYTDFGSTKRPGGKDAYEGTLPQFSATEATVALGCPDGPVTSKKWAGGSGSVAFDRDTSQTALAVITTYQSGKKRDQLMAVPLCYLLHADNTSQGFHHAIQFAAYERRRDYRERVIEVIAATLAALTPATLKTVAQALQELSAENPSGLRLDLDQPALATATAECMVSHLAVTDVIGCLDSLMEDLGPAVAERLDDIIDALLPLHYAPGVMHRLQAQLAADQLGLLESEVSTRTLAEIIMAGYDQQPARFATLTDGQANMRGATALDYDDEPEEGPGHGASQRISVLRGVRNLLSDLLALHDTLLGGTASPPSSRIASAQSEAEVQAEIDDYAPR